MIKVALVRGKYLNNFEGQNYIFDPEKIALTGISSIYPIHQRAPFPTMKLPSLADLGNNRFLKYTLNRLLGDSQILFGLEKLVPRFDIFHTADPHYYYSYQLARLRNKGVIKRLIMTSWETIPFNNETVARKKRIKQFTLKNVDYCICHTNKAKAVLVAEGIGEDKIKIIRLGVDLKKFKQTDSKKRQDKNITILFVGRLIEEKGIMDAYEAYRKIQNSKYRGQNYYIKFRIVGEGELKKHLFNMIKKDGFVGQVSVEKKDYEEMPKVYQKTDILVMPSKSTRTWEEQYGMVLIEAMATGLAIIAYKSGAIPEIVGDTGILVKEGDTKGLTQALSTLVLNQDLRKKLGTMARKRVVLLYDAQKTAQEIGKIYEEVRVWQLASSI